MSGANCIMDPVKEVIAPQQQSWEVIEQLEHKDYLARMRHYFR